MPQTPLISAERSSRTDSPPKGRPRTGLASELARLTQSAGSFDAALPATAEFLKTAAVCDALYSVRSPGGRGALRLEPVGPGAAEPSPVGRTELLLLAQKAIGAKTGLSIASRHGVSRTVAAVPVSVAIDDPAMEPSGGAAPPAGAERCMALVGVQDAAPADNERADLLTVLELAVASFSSGLGSEAVDRRNEARSAAALVELMTRTLGQPGLEQTFASLADIVCNFLGCQSVWLATRRRDESCEVVAVAGASVDRESAEFAAHVGALNETLMRDRPTRWPAVEPAERWGCLAHQRALEASGAAAIFSAPLRNAKGEAVGVWLLAGPRERLSSPSFGAWVAAAEEPVSTILETARLAHQSGWKRLWSKLPTSGWKTPRKVLAAVLLAVAALLAPAPHRVSCESELQPVARRFVTVPFAGRLEHGEVKPGDTVAAGALLARMDGREVELELAAVRADLHRAAKRRDGELADHDFGAAHLSGFEVERLTARADLLQSRVEQLEIRSPIDGIVVSGDLQRMDGAALKIGQSLYEIAPLSRMTVEIAIPEDDVSFVHPGMPLTLRLESSQSHVIEGQLVRLHPRSEIRNERNVFIGELEVENPLGALRPGMRGTARISAGWRSLGWIWLHKAWERFLSWW